LPRKMDPQCFQHAGDGQPHLPHPWYGNADSATCAVAGLSARLVGRQPIALVATMQSLHGYGGGLCA